MCEVLSNVAVCTCFLTAKLGKYWASNGCLSKAEAPQRGSEMHPSCKDFGLP